MNFNEHYKYSEFRHIPVGEWGYLLQSRGIISRVKVLVACTTIDKEKMTVRYQYTSTRGSVWCDSFNIFPTMEEASIAEKRWGYRSTCVFNNVLEYSSEHKGRTTHSSGWLASDEYWKGEGFLPF